MKKDINVKNGSLKAAIDILQKDSCTLAVLKGDEVYTSHESGVRPLMQLLSGERKSLLVGASIADKVIGKAAALLMIYGKVAAVYTDVISEPALQCFEQNHIFVTYGLLVERIENRSHTGLCPMETLCMEINDPQEAYKQIMNSPILKGIKREEAM